MKISPTHRWDVTPQDAIQIQSELAACVVERGDLRDVRLVAGVDVGLEGQGNQIMRAAVVALAFPSLMPVDYAIARLPVAFPYIPGLLAFREIPVVQRALGQLKSEPDVLILDGHGRSHPRRLGIACHLGVLLNRATIGCAKSRLCGVAKEPRNQVGAWTPLMEGNERIGAVLRTRLGTKPLYVSVGHKVGLDGAIELVLKCCKKYRLPETTRYAHRVAAGEALDLKPQQMELL